MRSLLPAFLLIVLALAPEAGSACALCLASESEATKYAFVWTTVLLSVLPPGMVGLCVGWIYLRARQQSERASQAAASAS